MSVMRACATCRIELTGYEKRYLDQGARCSRCRNAYSEGAAAERARIVAWLRGQIETEAGPAPTGKVASIREAVMRVADALERGDHLRDGGER